MTCFNGESVAEVTETTLDVKFFEHESPHGREELEDASKTERQRERERKRKAGSFQPFQKSHLQPRTCE